MPDATPSKFKPYILTVLTFAAATALRMALTPVVNYQYPFITFFPAVAVVARYAGFRFAVASVILDAVAAATWFYNPRLVLRRLSIADVLGMSLFVALGFLIAWLTEQERRAKASALRHLRDLERERSLAQEQATLLQLAHDAVFVMQLDGTIEFWNRGAEEMYGYTAGQACGSISHELLKTVFPKPVEHIQQELLERGRWQGDLIHTCADGRELHVSSRWALRRVAGKPTGFLEITRDITERRKLDEQLRQAAKMESLGILAGGIAHDFNNLLTGIMGNASLALENTTTANPNRQLLLQVVAASQRAADLTRQMLAYAGKGRFVTQRFDISELVRELSPLLDAAIPKNIQLRLDIAPHLPAIEGDVGQLQQVVMNLVINGAEAMGPQTGAVLITTSVQEVDEQYVATLSLAHDIGPGTYVVLEVHDTGSGMDERMIAKIFDPFFTTKFQGRGLGLAAVQGIVRSHKGAIKVYSTPGKGTTFKVLFPATGAPAARIGTPEPGNYDRLRGSGTVLVIDDEPFVRTTAKATLERYGYNVITAMDGREGVELLRKHQAAIRVVLLDLTMPVMNGEEALRIIRTINPTIPVVLSSGFNEVEAIRRFTGKGLAGFIQKPYTAAALATKVKHVIDRPAS
jgi:PAS domain S-box-containing protein